MDPRLQLRVQRYGWDSAVDYYNDGWSTQLRPAHDQFLAMAYLKPGQNVIEIASGTGLVTLRAAQVLGPTGAILATDLSQKMVDDLIQRAAEAGISTITAQRIGAEDLGQADNTFDAALCALGLMYVPDPGKAVREMARVIKPGGTVTATVWGQRKNCGWADVFPIIDARVDSEVCPMFFGTGAKGALVMDFKAASLSDIAEHRQSEILNFANAEQVITSVLLGGPVAMAAKRFSDDVWQDVKAEFLLSVAAFEQPDGCYRIPCEFVTVRGTKPLAYR